MTECKHDPALRDPTEINPCCPACGGQLITHLPQSGGRFWRIVEPSSLEWQQLLHDADPPAFLKGGMCFPRIVACCETNHCKRCNRLQFGNWPSMQGTRWFESDTPLSSA